jgi:cytochrome d ubiquinol oxidase subunit II
MGIDLPLLWIIIIAVGLMNYVILDGFDLGIGILLPFVPDRADRNTMINTVAPVWDGNETWLVLGGVGLLAAFPLAYSVVLSACYLPIMLMLAGLIFRGVAFEFRVTADEANRPFWEGAFAWGSYIATFCQGVVLGSLINGLKVSAGTYSGGPFDWLTPFSLFTGLGLLIAYALLGSTWLVMKTEGKLQSLMQRLARPVAMILLLVIAGVSLWTPLSHPAIAARWFAFPNIVFFAPVPILVLLVTWTLLRTLERDRYAAAFVQALVLMFLGYTGLLISVWPHIIPPDISFRDAAAPPESMGFALVGALFVIPFILVYTAWSYYVFRGKVRVGESYE